MTCKRCPFCGSAMKLEVWEGMRGTAIECTRCGAQGPQAFDEDEALKWWNEASRPRGEQLIAQHTRCRARLASMARRRRRDELREKAAREREEAPKRKREREYREWASERAAWLRAPVDEDTIQ
jgi:Lar family restriction alleviation protein